MKLDRTFGQPGIKRSGRLGK